MEVLVEKHSENSHSPLVALLLSTEAHDSLLHALDDECSRLRRRELLVRVQALVPAADWQTFYRVVLEGRSPIEAAGENGFGEHAVRASVYRVHRMLQEDLQKMEGEF
jgi:DNA-directed RNA polymerase specialized sigma24 family protein